MLLYKLTFCVFVCAVSVEASSKTRPKSGISETQLKSGYVDGDFIVGALFPVHEQPLLYTDEYGPLECGMIRENYGIQRVEAAFFAIDSINNNTDLLPGIRLGIHSKDGCWSDSVILHQTLALIEEPSLQPIEVLPNNTEKRCRKKPTKYSPLVGIVGPAPSGSSILVQNILKLFQIPQIGYSATTPELANTALYPYYLRVVPSDSFQNRLIIQLLETFNWTYVSVVYTDALYGQNAVADFRRNVVGRSCVANYKPIDPTAKEKDFDDTIRALNLDEKANVIVCYCEGVTVTGLLLAIHKAELTGRFMFLGSDAWSTRSTVVGGLSKEAKGSITIGIEEIRRREFDEYFFQLNPMNNQRDPWFNEFWEYRFDCSMNDTDLDFPACTGSEDLREEYEQDLKVDYVMKSVYAIAHGLHAMHKDVCHNEPGPCKALRHFNTSLFWEYLVKTNFSYYGEYVNFHSTGEPRKVKYNIYNYQQVGKYKYEYVQIGRYVRIEDSEELELFSGVAIQYPGANPIKSVCSEPCPPGSAKLTSKGNQDQVCCWSCVPCQVHEILVNETTCIGCFEGFWPDRNQTHCRETSLGTFLIGFSSFGIFVTCVTTIIFVAYQHTPVVKSSTRELCYVMLIGMIMAHSLVFAIQTQPTIFTCFLVRTLPPISFSVIYASLLVKTNRIARILAMSKKKFPNMRPRFMSLAAQLIITFTLIAIQVAICVVLLIEEPPIREDQVFRDLGSLICSSNARVILLPFVFVGLLLVACTLYAVKTRNLPDNFNEAKFIGFSMYVTCITWVAFGLIYFGSRLKIITLCICSSTNALVVLSFLFFPKLYIILCRPERNTRANFTTTKGIRCTIAVGKNSQTIADKGSKCTVGKDFKKLLKLKNNKKPDVGGNGEVEKLEATNV